MTVLFCKRRRTHLTCVLESGLSQGSVPFRRNSAILALRLCARTIVRGIHSSVSSVAYPNIRPCEPCSEQNHIMSSYSSSTSYSSYPAVNHIAVYKPEPGHQLPHPPPFDPGERLERCQGTAAPEPPAHCRSYSQILSNKNEAQINRFTCRS